ncbi:MAG: hypothetical protein ACREJO_05985 [Phycisphaerales bacterium]
MSTEGLIDTQLQERLTRELQPGERIVWSGQPLPRAFARGSLPVAVFGLFFGGFALFWMLMAGGGAWFASAAPQSNGPPPVVGTAFSFLTLCGLPFLAVGVVMLTMPIWRRVIAGKIIYAITDKRAVVIGPEAWRGTVTRSFAGEKIANVARAERSDGSGDLVFEEIVSYSSSSDGASRHVTRRGFIGVGRVAEVERILRKTLLSTRGIT